MFRSPPTGRPRPSITDSVLVMLRLSGYSLQEIAQASGLAVKTVADATAGVEKSERIKPLNHLPSERTLRIVAAIINGDSDDTIAQRLAVTAWRVATVRKSTKEAGLL